MTDSYDVPDRLVQHLERWLGRWPAVLPGLDILGLPERNLPGWDGRPHRVIGVTSPDGAVLSVPPESAEELRHRYDVLRDLDALGVEVPAVVGMPTYGWFEGGFRWTTSPAPLPEVGVWLPHDDPLVPEWLRPFGGDVLIALDEQTGEYLAGVGIKRHDTYGKEISVGTDERARGRGLARKLVAQAARRVLDEGGVPTYLYEADNHASAKVASAAGFVDHGWHVIGLTEDPVTA